MTDKAKIHLSKFEKELIANKDWILTKRRIIEKIYHLFGAVQERYKEILQRQNNFFSPLIDHAAKISKGENYEGLPYVIMDYPALFTKEKIIAIRTMFWWGNFFSVTLHLAGKDIKIKEEFLFQNDLLQKNNFFICVNENQWQHHFEPSNFIHSSALDQSGAAKILGRDFIKIAKKTGVNNWEAIPDFLAGAFNEIIEYAGVNFPTGERVL